MFNELTEEQAGGKCKQHEWSPGSCELKAGILSMGRGSLLEIKHEVKTSTDGMNLQHSHRAHKSMKREASAA